MRLWWMTCALAIGAMTGCYDWRAEVRRAASLDHGCPVEQVRVIEDNGNRSVRIAALEVCGRRRVYRDVNTSGENVVWVDSTGVVLDDLTYEGARPDGTAVVGASPVAAGEGTPAEAQSLVRAHLDARAGAILACTSGASVAIEAGWGPGASAVSFSPSDVADPSIAACVISAAGALAPPEGVEHGHVVHALSAP